MLQSPTTDRAADRRALTRLAPARRHRDRHRDRDGASRCSAATQRRGRDRPRRSCCSPTAARPAAPTRSARPARAAARAHPRRHRRARHARAAGSPCSRPTGARFTVPVPPDPQLLAQIARASGGQRLHARRTPAHLERRLRASSAPQLGHHTRHARARGRLRRRGARAARARRRALAALVRAPRSESPRSTEERTWKRTTTATTERRSAASARRPGAPCTRRSHEVKRVIVGQDAMLERLLVSLLAGGHVLLEGVPGLAKTLTVKTLAQVLGGSFRRIQFTPDLVPGRPRRHADLPARHGELRHRARAGVRELPARRRDQPRARRRSSRRCSR